MRGSVVGLLVLICISTPAASQETTGSLRGRVVDVEGFGVPAVEVAVSGRLITTRTTGTDADGYFLVLALPHGDYSIEFSRIGARSVILRNVAVQLGRTTGLQPVTLTEEAVELGPLVISANAQTLDPIHNDGGARLRSVDYAALPGSRDYTSILSILPHANESHLGDGVNVGGSTGIENMYFIDGVNVTDPMTAESGVGLPYNFVRAVEVKTGGYEAQYGRALGAVVNAVTHSGTNDFELHTFGFLSHGELAARPRSVPSLTETGRLGYDIGLRVSGPVARDRLWFSAAYNPRVDRADRAIDGHGSFEDRRVSHLFAGKLTWQAVQRLTVEASLFGDPTVHEGVESLPWLPGYSPLDPSSFLLRHETGGISAAIRSLAAMPNGWLLEAFVGRSMSRDGSVPRLGVVDEPLFIDRLAQTVEGDFPFGGTVEMTRTTASVRATVPAGRHTLGAGLEWEEAEVSRVIESVVVQRVDSARYTTTTQGGSGTFRSRTPAAYVQDSWRLTDRLTVNGGIRWSTQIMYGASGLVAQRFGDEWQPRVGFVRQLGRDFTHRLFGSYGRFYQQLPLNLSTLWHLDYVWIQRGYDVDPRLPGATPTDSLDGTTYEVDYRRVPGVQAEQIDEFTLGYERLIGTTSKAGVRVIRRDLRSAFGQAIDTRGGFAWRLGRIGHGDLDFLPEPERTYTALEVSTDGVLRGFDYRASYVLSRSEGNYSGLYQSDLAFANPGTNQSLLTPEQAVNSTGPLPNDRPHVFKLSAARRTGFGLTLGSTLTVASGAPINGFAPGPVAAFARVFVVPRGSAGRLPALWDLGLRLSYDVPSLGFGNPRLLLDVLHIGNPQTVVRVDETQYLTNTSGLPSNTNPRYREPLAYQQPAMVRLGMDVSF